MYVSIVNHSFRYYVEILQYFYNFEIFHPKVYEKISFQRKYGGVSYIVKSNTIRIKSVSKLATNIYKSISSKEKFGKRQEKNRTRM